MKLQKAITPTKSKLFFNFIILTLFSISQAPNSANAQSPRSLLQTGLEFQESPFFNVGSITSLLVTQTTYSGSCVGGSFIPSSSGSVATRTEVEPARARFVSSATPPASELRVIIRNITEGIDQNPSPYTNRKYNKQLSEQFQLRLGTSHSDQYLAVREGKNNFSYEIKRNNTVIESGTFTATINHGTRTVNREISIPQEVCELPGVKPDEIKLPDMLKN